MSASGSSRLSSTSPSLTAAWASSRYFFANSWTLLSNADMPRNWPRRMSFSFVISSPDGLLAPSRPIQRACMSASNVALRFFISSSSALVARSSKPWYSDSSAISGAMPACFCCSYSAATCWKRICARASLSKFAGMPVAGEMPCAIGSPDMPGMPPPGMPGMPDNCGKPGMPPRMPLISGMPTGMSPSIPPGMPNVLGVPDRKSVV
mmetsp:Transcript_40224/g.121543  ORF Transcript_40224/g.121543 Transcript_40224/m.121543 type:complete len:207 (+) Transcript_40224:218-838(+)